MGAVNGAAFSLAGYLDSSIGLSERTFTRFSASRLALVTLLVAVMSYMATGTRLTLAPWLMALILLAFIACIAIIDERSRPAEDSHLK